MMTASSWYNEEHMSSENVLTPQLSMIHRKAECWVLQDATRVILTKISENSQSYIVEFLEPTLMINTPRPTCIPRLWFVL